MITFPFSFPDFISLDVKMIVIACNTATTRCINHLRNKYKWFHNFSATDLMP